MELDKVEIVTRSSVAEDINFVMRTWLMGNYYGNPFFRQMFPDTYYKNYGEFVKSILSSPETVINIACDKHNPSWIVGFIVINNNIIHWYFTKKDYRGKGILNLLLSNKDINTVTHTTNCGKAINEKKGWVFNPYATS